MSYFIKTDLHVANKITIKSPQILYTASFYTNTPEGQTFLSYLEGGNWINRRDSGTNFHQLLGDRCQRNIWFYFTVHIDLALLGGWFFLFNL